MSGAENRPGWQQQMALRSDSEQRPGPGRVREFMAGYRALHPEHEESLLTPQVPAPGGLEAQTALRERQEEAVSATTTAPSQALPEDDPTQAPPLGYAVAQLHGVYILSQTSRGLVVVDMHAAHERITYEGMKQQVFADADSALEAQPLLVPVSLAVSAAEVETAEQCREAFSRLGVELDVAGPETLLVRQVPSLLAKADVEPLIRDMLADLERYGDPAKLAAMRAIKAALDPRGIMNPGAILKVLPDRQ